MTMGLKANADGSGAIQVGGSDAITITSALDTTFAGTVTSPTGALYPLVSGAAQGTTSGTSKDFTGIPSTVKRVTVMLSGVSTSGTSNLQIQIGSGSVTSSGYASTCTRSAGTAVQTTTATSGFLINIANANNAVYGAYVITLVSGFAYVEQGNSSDATNAANYMSAGGVTLSGALDRVRLTTVNGTDTFDAGSVNIMWE